MKRYWVMDYETLPNCFIAVFTDLFTNDIKIFEIAEFGRNDIEELIDFVNENINSLSWHLGFNNIAFDSQITQNIIKQQKVLRYKNAGDISAFLYAVAQKTIESTSKGNFPEYSEYDLSIPVIDIFKLNHWDNPAKSSSLKWIQFTMDWENVEEMPFDHTTRLTNREDIDSVISYCINDVASTKAIFLYKNSKGEEVMKSQVNLRSELSQTYGTKLYSASEPRISKEIFSYFLRRKLNIDKKTLSVMRTNRESVNIRDIIIPTIKFSTPDFIAAHNWFKSLIIDSAILEGDENKKGPKYNMHHKNVDTVFGLGGLHGCIRPGIYKAEGSKIIKSVDVVSFYPNLAIKNEWSPAHLPKKEFCELYEWFFYERKKYPKSSPLNYLFKIILNSTYGLSKSKFSFLYDPEFTFKITVNGQLQLCQLYEMITTRIPGSQPLMQNTDGLEFIIDKKDEELFNTICKEWEAQTKLELEHVNYEKMIIMDVNNYIAVYESGKTKCKGRFEFEELALHKNKSAAVIPKALYEYFINGVKPEDYIASNKNIFDYCIGSKIKGDWKFQKVETVTDIPEKYFKFSKEEKEKYLLDAGWETWYSPNNWVKRSIMSSIDKAGLNLDDAFKFELNKEKTVKTTDLQKIVRYYVSNKGCKIYKLNKSDGRKLQLEAGKWHQTIFNKAVKKEWKEYNIDEKYYITQIYSIIDSIMAVNKDVKSKQKSQLTLL